MPAQGTVAQANVPPVIRSVRLHLWPERKRRAYRLAGTTGAGRFVGPHCRARPPEEYAAYPAGPVRTRPPYPAPGWALSSPPGGIPPYAGLQAYGPKAVTYILHYLAAAFPAFVAGGGYPRFKRKQHPPDGCTLPSGVQVSDHHLYVPAVGGLRQPGANPSAGGRPRMARIRQEGPQSRPQGYAYIPYAVPVDSATPPTPQG